MPAPPPSPASWSAPEWPPRGESDGFLVVRRIDYLAESAWARAHAAERPPAVALTHAQVLAHYRGFDGDPWPPRLGGAPVPLVDGLAPLAAYEAVAAYAVGTPAAPWCDLLYLQRSDPAAPPPPLPAGFVHLGYDCGYYTWEYALFSCLLHEVIYGVRPELRTFAAALNAHLLMPTLAAAEALRAVREPLRVAGVPGVETSGAHSGYYTIVPIYGTTTRA